MRRQAPPARHHNRRHRKVRHCSEAQVSDAERASNMLRVGGRRARASQHITLLKSPSVQIIEMR